ncbi:hypothetical protein MRX96_003328 [Rhipicephalus microplus]
MATQQGYTTDQGRRRQERPQASRHDYAEHNAQPANGQEDENSQSEIHDEDAEGLVRGPLMWPIVAQPFFYIPPTNAAVYHYVVPPYDPYVPVVQDHGGLAAPEYIQLVQSSTLWNLHGNHRKGEGPQRGTGEPYEGTRGAEEVGVKEGRSDVKQNTVAGEPIQHKDCQQQVKSANRVHLRHCARVDTSVHGAVREVNTLQALHRCWQQRRVQRHLPSVWLHGAGRGNVRVTREPE